MVIVFTLLFLFPVFTMAQSEPANVQFNMELSKRDFYQGELITATFALTAKAEVAEVEVSKFPEFRGFWSENLVLRQGPIPLLPIGGNQNPDFNPLNPFRTRVSPGLPPVYDGKPRRGIVGSYILSSMVGKEDVLIEPMKIVVKGTTYSSVLPAHKIHPLPPIPQSYSTTSFSGAVGSFSLQVENPELPFRKEEPVQLRIHLQGEGNFQEINEVPLSFPEQLEVLSKKSYIHGSGQYSAKTFETVLKVKSSENVILPGNKFLFFNPDRKRYMTLILPNLHFFPAPNSVILKEDPIQIQMEPDRTWTDAFELAESLIFWLIQLCIGFTGLLYFLFIAWKNWKAIRQQTPQFFKRQVYAIAVDHYKNKKTEDFLNTANSLALKILEDLQQPHELHVPRLDLFRRAESRWGNETRKVLEDLILTYERRFYSFEKTSPQDTEIYLKNLKFLTKKAS